MAQLYRLLTGEDSSEFCHKVSLALARGWCLYGDPPSSYDGQTIELNDALTHDGKLQFFTWNDSKGKEAFWHSSAHVLAQAILHFYPNAKLTIGPAIAMCPFCRRVTRPATITAPGAMNKTPKKSDIRTPN